MATEMKGRCSRLYPPERVYRDAHTVILHLVSVRWTIDVSEATDQRLRAYLAERELDEGDLSLSRKPSFCDTPKELQRSLEVKVDTCVELQNKAFKTSTFYIRQKEERLHLAEQTNTASQLRLNPGSSVHAEISLVIKGITYRVTAYASVDPQRVRQGLGVEDIGL